MLPTMTYRTYTGWIQSGRHVRAGEKAQQFKVSPDGKTGVAVFGEDQTDPLTPEVDITDWELVPRAVWKAPKERKHQAKVRQHLKGVAVWCGNDTYVIDLLKRAGYGFDQRINRWVKTSKTVDEVVLAFQRQDVECTVEEAPPL